MTEKQLKARLKTWLPKNTHFQPIESSTAPGIPDINICLNGKEIWLELKIVLGKKKLSFQKDLSPYQWNWILSRLKAEGEVWVVGQHNEDVLLYDCKNLWPAFRNNRRELPSHPSVRLSPMDRGKIPSYFTRNPWFSRTNKASRSDIPVTSGIIPDVI